MCVHACVHMKADILGGQWYQISLKLKLKLCKVGARDRTQTSLQELHPLVTTAEPSLRPRHIKY